MGISDTDVVIKGSRVFVTRHHKHHVPGHKDHPYSIGTFEARIHQRDWIYTHAGLGRCTDIPPIERLHCQTLQGQHEAAIICSV